jgi:hypothetical protein
MQIRQTIPHTWRTILQGAKQENTYKNPKLDKLRKINTLKSKDIYWMILYDEHDLLSIPNAHKYWTDKYDLSDEMLKTTYTLPYKVTKTTYIQSIQFKILYKIINCNHWLHKIKIRDSPICSFCDEIDTIVHYFFACKETKLYWKAILNWWNHLDNMYITLFEEKSIIIGIPWVCSMGKILNSCLLIAKTTIYKSKNHNTQPNLSKSLFDLSGMTLQTNYESTNIFRN